MNETQNLGDPNCDIRLALFLRQEDISLTICFLALTCTIVGSIELSTRENKDNWTKLTFKLACLRFIYVKRKHDEQE